MQAAWPDPRQASRALPEPRAAMTRFQEDGDQGHQAQALDETGLGNANFKVWGMTHS